MNTNRNLETPAGFSPGDIYFVIFRHKWKIIILAALGMVAAGVYYFARQPLWQSGRRNCVSSAMSISDIARNPFDNKFAGNLHWPTWARP